MKRILLLLLLMPVCLHAQKKGQDRLDSLTVSLAGMKEDTNRVNVLSRLSSGYSDINPDSGLKYGLQGLELATHFAIKKQVADANNNVGFNFYKRSDFAKALAYFAKADILYQELGDKKGSADNDHYTGAVYYEISNYSRALEYYLRSLKIGEEIGYRSIIGANCYNIGILYSGMGNPGKAQEYFVRALKIYEELKNKRGIGNAYDGLSNLFKEQGDYTKALEYSFKNQKIADEIGDKALIAANAVTIGEIYIFLHDYRSAVAYAVKAQKAAEAAGDKYDFAWGLTNAGQAYILIAKDLGDGINESKSTPRAGEPAVVIPEGKAALLHAAISNLEKALAIGQDEGSLDVIQGAYQFLAEAYRLSGNYKKALEYSDSYRAIKDSVFSKENGDKIVRQDMQYGYDKIRFADSLKTQEKERMNGLRLRRQRNYTYAGLGGVLLLAGFSFFIVKERRKSEIERRKSDSLLLNILPAEVAEELKRDGKTLAKQFDHVSVLFTDFVNFTGAAENLSPQQLVQELHECFSAFDAIIERNGMEKIKTIGDAYLAVCGLPVNDGQHASRTARAALEIRDLMARRMEQKATFEIRIGINSGPVVAGIVGVKKFAYDIWGDTVNTAARMEQHGAPGKINISEITYELVKDEFECMHRGNISAKNKGEMSMYFLERTRASQIENTGVRFAEAKSYITNRLRKELPGHLSYHSVTHIEDVYESAGRIGAAEGMGEEDMQLLLTAAMYHDCGFIVQAKEHERISCEIAQKHLPDFGFTDSQIEKICGMIMATAVPQVPHNLLEQIICDADLDYLGRDDFFTIGNRLYAELKTFGVVNDENDWNKLQVRFLEAHTYFTKTAIATRKPKKDEHLTILKLKL